MPNPPSLIGPSPSPASRPPDAPDPQRPRWYLPVRAKFGIAIAASVLWACGAAWLAQRWVHDLSQQTGPVLAYLVIYGIAVIPGFMNAFLVVSCRVPDDYARS